MREAQAVAGSAGFQGQRRRLWQEREDGRSLPCGRLGQNTSCARTSCASGGRVQQARTPGPVSDTMLTRQVLAGFCQPECRVTQGQLFNGRVIVRNLRVRRAPPTAGWSRYFDGLDSAGIVQK